MFFRIMLIYNYNIWPGSVPIFYCLALLDDCRYSDMDFYHPRSIQIHLW